MTDPKDEREALGYILAGYFSGNNQPDMSGDPRKRLSPLRRRDMDDAITEILRAGHTRGDSAAMREALERIAADNEADADLNEYGAAEVARAALALPAPEPVAVTEAMDAVLRMYVHPDELRAARAALIAALEAALREAGR